MNVKHDEMLLKRYHEFEGFCSVLVSVYCFLFFFIFHLIASDAVQDMNLSFGLKDMIAFNLGRISTV